MARELPPRKRKRTPAFEAEDKRYSEWFTEIVRELAANEPGGAFQRALFLKKRHPTRH